VGGPTGGGLHRVLLITGPNTGGKTVALKTAGLLSLMAQAGLPVPADRGTQVPVFGSVFADIGDEQSIEQSLSTFSSHMRNIIRIVGEADARSLVLLDELAAGTDPTEGAALARSILLRLLDLGALTVATTHHGELKAFAHAMEGVTNASVEFNVETLSPTYHLSIGLPGRSNALEIAQRLGMPRDIIDDARGSIAPEQRQVDDMLTDIRRERDDAASARRAEETARRESEEIRARLEERLEGVEDEREQMVAQAREEIERETERVTSLLAEAEREAEAAKGSADAFASVAQEKLREAVEAAKKAEEKRVQRREQRRTRGHRPAARTRIAEIHGGPRPEEIQAGDHVWLRGMDRFGEAMTAPDAKGEVEIRLGALKSRIKLSQVERVQRPHASQAHGEITADFGPMPDVALELDLRGQTVDEALPAVERYLDDAFRAAVPEARIIHGKGTGTLRRVVREMLAKHPFVTSYEEAQREYGGEGVTIVKMAL
jgi:DNA mismatch repair protein MutS2